MTRSWCSVGMFVAGLLTAPQVWAQEGEEASTEPAETLDSASDETSEDDASATESDADESETSDVQQEVDAPESATVENTDVVDNESDTESDDDDDDDDDDDASIIEMVMEALEEEDDEDAAAMGIWFRPVTGWRWIGGTDESAFVLGLNTGMYQQLNDPSRKVALGVASRARYEGAMGDARGRTLMTDGRFVLDADILEVQVGGGLQASRHLFETTEDLSGVLAAAGDARVGLNIAAFHLLAGARPSFFLTGDRPARNEGPLLGVGDEFSHILGARVFLVSATWTRTYTAAGPIEMVIIGFER